MNIEPLRTYFSKHLLLDEMEVEFLETVFTEKKVRRKQYILQQGDVYQLNTFVVEGCFRMFLVDEQGKEHNLQFAIENGWILDMESFYFGQPSRLNIEAIEHSIVYQIKKEDQFKLFTEYPKFNHIFGEILLLFIGIYFAIWFNNLNASNKINKNEKNRHNFRGYRLNRFNSFGKAFE
jgi:CRP-like cAMP-binding protein